MIKFLLAEALKFHAQLDTVAVFLRVNNFVLRCSQDELVEISLKIAENKIGVDEVKYWLLQKSAGVIFITGDITIHLSAQTHEEC